MAAPPPSPLTGLRVAFIGGGNMASAIAAGLVSTGVLPPSALAVASPSGGGARMRGLGVSCHTSNAAAAAGADIVVLAVKPWVVAPAVQELAAAGVLDRERLTLVSVAAGTSVAQVTAALCAGAAQPAGAQPAVWRVVRAMPNTPCSVGEGATGVTLGPHATAEDGARVTALFSSVGCVVTVTEPQLDAVTGLSGSGPAYVFMMIEALADGGVAAGLPRPAAMTLAAQLVRGSAGMLQSTGRHPGELKDAVASPGGTTIAGIHALETGGFRGAVMSAVVAASKRCGELRGPA